MAVFDTLDFVDAVRPGGRNQQERRYYDYQVSGRALRTMIPLGDHAGVFGWLPRDAEAGFARQLLLRAPSELASSRVPLYVCPECGDLGCGGITARVVADHDSVAWLDLGFEANYGDPPADFFEVRPFYFEKRAYEVAIRRFWPRGGR